MEILKRLAKLLTVPGTRILPGTYRYLLTEGSLDLKMIQKMLSDSNRFVPVQILHTLLNHKNPIYWDFKNFRKYTGQNKFPLGEDELNNKLNQLYKEYLPNLDLPQIYHEKLRDLVFLEIFGTLNPEYLLRTYKPIGDYNIPKKLFQIVDTLLQEKNILVISGTAGIGKSYLANAYIKQNNTYDVSWYTSPIDSKHSLEKDIDSLTFQFDTFTQNKLNYLQSIDMPTLLVIQHAFLDKSDYEFLNANLLNRQLRIIILTIQKMPEEYEDKFNHYHISSLPNETLKYVLTNNIETPLPISSDEDFCALYDIVNYNVLVLSLLNKTLQKKPDFFTRETLLDKSYRIVQKTHPLINTTYYNPLFTYAKTYSGHDARIRP